MRLIGIRITESGIDANVSKTTFEKGYKKQEECDLYENRAARI
jgi:hypothetical protein